MKSKINDQIPLSSTALPPFQERGRGEFVESRGEFVENRGELVKSRSELADKQNQITLKTQYPLCLRSALCG